MRIWEQDAQIVGVDQTRVDTFGRRVARARVIMGHEQTTEFIALGERASEEMVRCFNAAAARGKRLRLVLEEVDE